MRSNWWMPFLFPVLGIIFGVAGIGSHLPLLVFFSLGAIVHMSWGIQLALYLGNRQSDSSVNVSIYSIFSWFCAPIFLILCTKYVATPTSEIVFSWRSAALAVIPILGVLTLAVAATHRDYEMKTRTKMLLWIAYTSLAGLLCSASLSSAITEPMQLAFLGFLLACGWFYDKIAIPLKRDGAIVMSIVVGFALTILVIVAFLIPSAIPIDLVAVGGVGFMVMLFTRAVYYEL